MSDTAGKRYDAAIKGLFEEMFEGHPFNVLPEVVPVAPLKPEKVKKESDLLDTARINADNTANYDLATLTPFAGESEKIAALSFDNSTSLIQTRLPGEYAYSLQLLPSAICLSKHDDKLREKLSDSANVLERYVGSYIAAVMELLLDHYFNPGIEKFNLDSTLKVQTAVMNLDWRVESSKNFFGEICTHLLRDIRGALPSKLKGTLPEVYNNALSQFGTEDTYVDFALRQKNPERSAALTAIAGHLSCIPGTFTQLYKIKNIYVEIKVKTAPSHKKRDHYTRAIASVNRHTASNVTSACFSLSHFRDEDTASTSTTTAFELPGGYRCYEHEYIDGKRVEEHVLPAVHDVVTTFTPDSVLMASETAYWSKDNDVWVPRISPKKLAGLCVRSGKAYLFEYVLRNGKPIEGTAKEGEKLDRNGLRQRVIAKLEPPGESMLRDGVAVWFWSSDMKKRLEEGHVWKNNGATYNASTGSINISTEKNFQYAPNSTLIWKTDAPADFEAAPFYPKPVKFNGSNFVWGDDGLYFNSEIPTVTPTGTPVEPLNMESKGSLSPNLVYSRKDGKIYAEVDGAGGLTAVADSLLLESNEYTPDDEGAGPA
jgi:hypothetical protein